VGLASVAGVPAGAGWFIGAQREPKNPALEVFRDNMRKHYEQWLAQEQGLVNREHVLDPETVRKSRPNWALKS